MSRRSEGQLFVGRLGKNVRTRELEDIFERYGRLARCEIKYGAEMAYAFVDFEDRRDAEDAVRFENGREIAGSSIIVEWAKGTPRRPMGYDECYKCHRVGHWARDCPDDRYYGYRRPRRGGGAMRGRSRDGPRRRRGRSYSRSRSRDRDRKRRRSRSRSRSRSRTPRRRPSRSHSRSRSLSASGSKSRSPSKSRSRSKTPNGVGKRSVSRSRSRSVDKDLSPGDESD